MAEPLTQSKETDSSPNTAPTPHTTPKGKKRKVSSLILLALCFISLIWASFVEPRLLTVTHLDVPVQEWKGTENEYTIVLLTDFHAGSSKSEEKRLSRIVKKVEDLSPDRILLLGDYCKGATMQTTMPPEKIGKLLAPLVDIAETDAVLGNHDDHCKFEVIDALTNAGIRVLEKESILVLKDGMPLQFSGTLDYTNYPKSSIAAIPERKSTAIPHILLTHSPDIFPKVPENKVSLIVAGHTHGGQICLPGGFPIITSSNYGWKYAYGFIKDDHGRQMIVSRGLGTSLLPLRFFCPPEIMVLHLKPAK